MLAACGLPDNFSTWFAITQLHVWMMMVRLRPEQHGRIYTQELVNRFFEDVEDRVRAHGVSTAAVPTRDCPLASQQLIPASCAGLWATD